MKRRLVLWGKDAEQAPVLLALDLQADDEKIDVYTFPEQAATEELNNLLMNQWRNDKPVEFPEEHQKFETELSLSESILPEDFTVDEEDILKRAQTEWNFLAMSSKMSRVYHEELEDLRERVDALEKFDDGLWEELKTYWDKVQTQIRDKNLIKEHGKSLRKKTDEAFAEMKVLRSKRDEKLREQSTETMEKYMNILDEIDEKIEKGLGLKPIFEQLKDIQRDFNKENFHREHRSRIWKRLDGAFKRVKKKRFGDKKKGKSSKLQHLHRRYDGLIDAIKNMEKSIRRDTHDRNYHQNRTGGEQLESQLREAKIMMIEERIRSKKEKLDDMYDTKDMLEQKIKSAEKKKSKKEEQKTEDDDQTDRPTSTDDSSETKQSAASVESHEPKSSPTEAGSKDDEGEELPDSLKEAAQAKGERPEDHFEELRDKTNGSQPSSEEE